MTAQDIAIVRDSFRKVAPIADHVVALYFARLFELDPSVRRLCCGGMEQQERRIVRTMGALIGWLETLEKLKPALRRLGARQAWRGARDEHYAFAGTALIWALEKALGPQFTAPVKTAWTRFYVELASAALDGAQLQPAAA